MVQEKLWQGVCLLLAVLLLVTAGGMGFEWLMAAHDRDQARADLKMEQGISAGLRVGINTQNDAISALAKEKAVADERAKLALQLADSNGKRVDNVLAKVKNVKAVTCADAMPVVNAVLEGLK